MLNELIRFLDTRCVKSNANISITAFHTSFKRWIHPEQCSLDTLLSLMSEQDQFSFEDSHVIGCAIPETQSEMVGS